MEDKDLVKGAIGAVGSYDVAFVGGQIVITAKAAVPEVGLSVSISVSPKEIIDAIAAKIGGPIPHEVALFIDAALGLK